MYDFESRARTNGPSSIAHNQTSNQHVPHR